MRRIAAIADIPRCSQRRMRSQLRRLCRSASEAVLLGRLTQYVGGLIFYQALFRFLLSFFLSFFRLLISELAERNSTISGQMVGSKCNLTNHLFGPTSQLNGNFNRLYLPNETRYRQSVKCVDNSDGSATSSQNDMNFGPQTGSNWK